MDNRGVVRLAMDRLMRKQMAGDQPDDASRRALVRGSIGALAGIAIVSLVAAKASAAGSKLAKSAVQYEDVSKRKGADCDDCDPYREIRRMPRGPARSSTGDQPPWSLHCIHAHRANSFGPM
jgi:hypothetical protein